MIAIQNDINEFRQAICAEAQFVEHVIAYGRSFRIVHALIQIVNVDRQLEYRDHRPRLVIARAIDIMMIAYRVTEEIRKLPVPADQIANDAMSPVVQ